MSRRTKITAIALSASALGALPGSASALTKVVYAGAPKAQIQKLAAKLLGKSAKAVKTYGPAFLSFAIQRVTVNQGDAVMWVGLMQFHSVDLPGKTNQDLPLFVHSTTVTGVKDFAGNPFWFDGVEPRVEFNGRLNGPIGGKKYNGTSRVDSGAPGSHTFKVTFTKPGVYKYFCDVHPGMIGYVVVRPKGKPIPSAKQDAAALTKQLTTGILSIKPLLRAKIPVDQVNLGASGAAGLALYHFFPATLRVKAGTVVTFSVPAGERTEGHTASFGPAAYLSALATSSSDASTQQTLYASSNPKLGPILLTPSSHGNGFASTGLLDQDPSGFLRSSTKIKFTTRGTYHFICLFHQSMTGTITVN